MGRTYNLAPLPDHGNRFTGVNNYNRCVSVELSRCYQHELGMLNGVPKQCNEPLLHHKFTNYAPRKFHHKKYCKPKKTEFDEYNRDSEK